MTVPGNKRFPNHPSHDTTCVALQKWAATHKVGFFTHIVTKQSRVLDLILPMCWVQHSQYASTSLSSTLLLTRVCPPNISALLASGPTFSAAAVYQRTVAAGNDFTFLGCITTSRCCWEACTVSIGEFSHRLTS